MRRSVTVLGAGTQALVTDLGRPGQAHLGVPPSGALDAPALRLANRLVGNDEGAAGLEVLLGGLELRAGCRCTVAVTGPSVRVEMDGRDADSHAPLRLVAGSRLRLGRPAGGLRCYLAFDGGVDVEPELGSRSTDVLSELGPPPLSDGDLLPLGEPMGPSAAVDVVPPEAVGARLWVPVLLGPRDDWFDDAAGQLAAGQWTVSASSNRVGLRLDGPALRRAAAYDRVELPSEAVATGAVQVPAGGHPVIFLADHPTTGGYPVVAVVHPSALPVLGQAAPGTVLRLRPLR